jgi:hypothetical protein
MDGQGDTSSKGHHRGKTQEDSHYFFNLLNNTIRLILSVIVLTLNVFVLHQSINALLKG